MGILVNMARRKSQSLNCRYPPGIPTGAMNPHLSSCTQSPFQASRQQKNGLRPCGPENVAPQVSAIHCIRQRHSVAHKVPDLSSKGWKVCSNIGQHNHPRLVLIAVCLPWQANRQRLFRSTTMRWSRRTLGVLSSIIKTSTRAIGGCTPFTLEQDSRRLCKKAESSGTSNRSSSFTSKRTGSSWASSPLKQAPYFRQDGSCPHQTTHVERSHNNAHLLRATVALAKTSSFWASCSCWVS